jgi:undecaprenyl-diphosphatase
MTLTMNFLAMPNINTRIFEFVNNAVGYYHPLDIFFIIATSYVTIFIVGIAIAYYFGVYLPWKAEGMARIKAFKNVAFIAASVAITAIVVSIIKVAVAFPRPFTTLPDIHTLISLPASYSFPSGHAAVTMALATSVYFYRKQLGSVLFVFAFAVGMARIYVGVHYPLDVGVGFLLGYVIPKLLQHFFVKKETLQLQ